MTAQWNQPRKCWKRRTTLTTAAVFFVIAAAGCSNSDESSLTRFDDADCDTVDLARIVTDPSNVTVDEGQDARFQVTALGMLPLRYAWLAKDSAFNDIEISQTRDEPQLTITGVTLADNGNRYEVTVSNACGRSATSARARLTVLASQPRIDSQPADISVNEGLTATFTVAASGSRPLTYQWQRNGVDIANATAATYTTAATTSADDAAMYSVVATNARGSTTSAQARLTVLAAPAIVRGPMPVTVALGQPATFAVVAAGAAPLKYQWRRNGADIAGATAASYTLASTAFADNGANYSVRVSNIVLPAGVVSSDALLTVSPPSTLPRGAADIVSLRMDSTLGGPDSGSGGLAHALSQDGRYVAFVSSAPLTSGGCGVFLRDTQMRQTRLITVRPDGTPATLPSGGNCLNAQVAMTPDARHVAFSSQHIDLVARSFGAGAVSRAYVRDTCIGAPSGCTPRTTLVAVDDADATLAGTSSTPSISDNGRHVVFEGRVPNQVSAVTGAVLHDRDADGNGVYDERPAVPNPADPTFRSFAVSRQNNGVLFTLGSFPMISGNGRFVVFAGALNSPGDCTRPSGLVSLCVYVYDRDANNNGILDETLVTGGVRTINVSVNTAGAVAQGGEVSQPSISADGRVVMFRTDATNLGAGLPALIPLYVHDRDVTASGFFDTAGNVSTQVASRDAAGTEVRITDFNGLRGISRRGRFVLLDGVGSWAAPTDPNSENHLYLRDTCAGAASPSTCVPSTVRLSVRNDGNLPTTSPTSTYYGALSGDGSRVAFSQLGGGLVDLDGNGVREEHTNREVYFGATGTGEP